MRRAQAWVGFYPDELAAGALRLDFYVAAEAMAEMQRRVPAVRYTLAFTDNVFTLTPTKSYGEGSRFINTQIEGQLQARFSIEQIYGGSVVQRQWSDGFRKTPLQDVVVTSSLQGRLPGTLNERVLSARGERKSNDSFIRVVSADQDKLALRARTLVSYAKDDRIALEDLRAFLSLLGVKV